MMRDRDHDNDGIVDVGSAQYTPGDPREDGDANGHPGFWTNFDAQGVLVQLVNKRDCTNPNGVLQVDMPRAEERVVPCPSPTPSPLPTPTPGPTPSPGGVDNTKLLRFGSEYFQCRVTGQQRTRIGVNNTPRVAQFPGDQRGWEQPREYQDPRGPDCTQSRTGPGAWSNELMENTSTNPYFCHTSLADEDAGREYTFRACPRSDVPLSPEPIPGYDRCGTVRVRFNARGDVTCIEGCKLNSPVGCTQ